MFEKIKNIKETAKLLNKLRNISENSTPEDVLSSLGIDESALDSMMQDFENMKVILEYKKDSNNEDLSYNYPSDSGFDLRANEEINLAPFGRALVSTGIYFNIPKNYEIQIRPKSGLAINKGLTVLNTPGTVDEGYTGEIKVIVINMDNVSHTIKKGEKVAQAVLCPVLTGFKVNLTKVASFKNKDRNSNGFGSTGN